MPIPPRYAALVFSLLMSLYMGVLMTLLITWINTGLSDGFLGRWWRAFTIAWPIAFVLTLLGAPPLQRLTAWLTHDRRG
ncbi:DUF2798 domain-containing protein [Halomonas beimenensis]|uniref:DUF2798 domain-containing protein n=1 Tax=Halomonas beimenensis TaxID=475662 RepID=A0A291PAS8_9GAMM|nr:DUF2798 domain-containing protein [Halomonas beimenensis]ATJ83987.1 hypothetical protein BEI_3000 [Halomonas beimenensis]